MGVNRVLTLPFALARERDVNLDPDAEMFLEELKWNAPVKTSVGNHQLQVMHE